MTYDFSAENVLKALNKAVRKYGASHKYNTNQGSCLYVRDGQPDCIVGQVFANIGIPLEEIEELNPMGSLGDIKERYNLPSWTADIPDPVVKALSDAQSLQDSGTSWGIARKAYKEYIAEHE